MKAEEKAKELVKKYVEVVYRGILPNPTYLDQIKQCALIAVDEVITELSKAHLFADIESQLNYWQEVKLEIEKL